MSDSVTPWAVAHQAPPSPEFSRQEYWSGLSFPSPGDLPDPGIELGSPALQADALPSEPPGRHQINIYFKGGLVEMREEGRSRRGYNVTKSLEVVLTGAIFSLIRNTRHKRNGSQAGS